MRIFAGGEALGIVGSDPGMVEIPSLRFHRNGRQISLAKTVKANLTHAPELFGINGPVSSRLDMEARTDKPDLVISDFEPFLARWAGKNRVPWMSIDHQHALTDTILPALGPRLDLEGRILSVFVEWLAPSRDRIVSSFHHFSPRQGTRARFVGCFLRPEVLDATPTDNGHACVYLKDPELLGRVALLAAARPDVRFEIWTDSIISLPSNAVCRPPHPVDFLHSLASCHWLLTTAGNQLLGEALRLGKPVLAIPAPGQTEQIYNAMALVDSACGDWSKPDELSTETVARFLGSHPRYVKACQARNEHPHQVDGTTAATEMVMERLGSAWQDQNRLGTRAVVAGPVGGHHTGAGNVPVGWSP
ncbi:MAG: hypothetical protein RL173_2723 [Fibrobacterota bacterium]